MKTVCTPLAGRQLAPATTAARILPAATFRLATKPGKSLLRPDSLSFKHTSAGFLDYTSVATEVEKIPTAVASTSPIQPQATVPEVDSVLPSEVTAASLKRWLLSYLQEKSLNDKQQWEVNTLHFLAGITAVGVALAVPGARVEPLAKLRTRLQELARAMHCSVWVVVQLLVLKPCMLDYPPALLANRHAALRESISKSPAWLDQYQRIHPVELAPVLANSGDPKYMRLEYVAMHGDEQHTELLDVLQLSDNTFAVEHPGFELWAEWNTPSYMFENFCSNSARR